jgi:hypothetical protein
VREREAYGGGGGGTKAAAAGRRRQATTRPSRRAFRARRRAQTSSPYSGFSFTGALTRACAGPRAQELERGRGPAVRGRDGCHREHLERARREQVRHEVVAVEPDLRGRQRACARGAGGRRTMLWPTLAALSTRTPRHTGRARTDEMHLLPGQLLRDRGGEDLGALDGRARGGHARDEHARAIRLERLADPAPVRDL